MAASTAGCVSTACVTAAPTVAPTGAPVPDTRTAAPERTALGVEKRLRRRSKGTRDVDDTLRPAGAPARTDDDRPTGFWSTVPSGAASTRPVSRPRHRVLTVLAVLHVPVLAALGVVRGVSGRLLWGQLVDRRPRPPASGRYCAARWRAPAPVSLGPMVGADVLVHVGGGLTDLHIWFYVVLALVALYQMWAPFLLAVGVRRRPPRGHEPLDAGVGVLHPRGPREPAAVRTAARGVPARRGDVPRLRLEVHRGGRPGPTDRAAARRGAGPRPGRCAVRARRRACPRRRGGGRDARRPRAAGRRPGGPARRARRRRQAPGRQRRHGHDGDGRRALGHRRHRRRGRLRERDGARGERGVAHQRRDRRPARRDDGGDRPDRREHLDHRGPDQPAGAQRHHRGGPRR